MYSNVPRQLVGPRESSITVRDGTGVRTFVNRGLARTIRILPASHRQQSYWQLSLLIHLRQDLVTFACALQTKGHKQFVRAAKSKDSLTGHIFANF